MLGVLGGWNLLPLWLPESWTFAKPFDVFCLTFSSLFGVWGIASAIEDLLGVPVPENKIATEPMQVKPQLLFVYRHLP